MAAVGGKVAGIWGAEFTRRHNVFMDRVNGRALRVVTGRRPDITGVFMFHSRTEASAVMAGYGKLWVALVPNVGEEFLLMPQAEVPWRGPEHPADQWVSIKFDSWGRPMEFEKWRQAMPAPKQKAAAARPR